MKHRATRLAAPCLALAAMLAGCGGGGTAHDTPGTVAWQPGVLQAAPVLTASFTAAQLQARMQAGAARDQALLALAFLISITSALRWSGCLRFLL